MAGVIANAATAQHQSIIVRDLSLSHQILHFRFRPSLEAAKFPSVIPDTLQMPHSFVPTDDDADSFVIGEHFLVFGAPLVKRRQFLTLLIGFRAFFAFAVRYL
jgi:hypothetical protein